MYVQFLSSVTAAAVNLNSICLAKLLAEVGVSLSKLKQ